MSATKRTPGPWRYQEESDAYTHIVRGPTGQYVAGCGQCSTGECEANARLIAAAPELLEALHCALNNTTGLAAYLATCATPTILESLETTIAALHKEAANYEAAIRKARGIAV